MLQKPLLLALSKGRIFKETLPLLASIGITPVDDPHTSRKLILDTSDPLIQLVILRATDVPTYVQYGAADMGVAGKDVLMEHGGEGIYEPLDLKIAQCKLMTAGSPHHQLTGKLKVATKYPHIARHWYAKQGQQVEIIKLYGSMELAPIVGLSDRIIDVVDTGNTLRANGLMPLEHIADISSRLIVNRASLKLKHQRIRALINALADTVEKV